MLFDISGQVGGNVGQIFSCCSQLHCSYNVIVSGIKFEWDEVKSQINHQKHGVSFNEARSVFYDEKGLLINDPDHSDDEDRFILGVSVNSLNYAIITPPLN